MMAGDGERKKVVLMPSPFLIAEPVAKKRSAMDMATATTILQAMPKAQREPRRPRSKPNAAEEFGADARKARAAG